MTRRLGRKRNLWFWLLWPGLYLYFRFSRRTRLAIVDGDKILLVQDRAALWFDDDRWSVPGGGLRLFERPEKGAVRELSEELGVTIEPDTLRLLWRGKLGEYGLKYRGYFYLAQLPKATKLRLRTSEIAAAQWRPISSLEPQDVSLEAYRALRLLAGKD